MILEHVFQAVEVQLQDLSRCLWPDDSLARIQKRCHRLSRSLPQRYGTLIRCRRLIELVLHRIRQHDKRVALLTAQVDALYRAGEETRAWRQAVELDQLRQLIDQERALLERQQGFYQRYLTGVERTKRQVDRLQDQISLRHLARAHDRYPTGAI